MKIQSTPSLELSKLTNVEPITFDLHISDVPHGNQQRRLYSVPNGKGAVLLNLYSAIEMATAPSTPLERYITYDLVKGLDYDVEIWSLHFNETANTKRVENHWHGEFHLPIDSQLRASTQDLSTGGTAWYTYHATLLQYDLV